MNQYSGWEHTLFYMKKLYLKKKGNSLEATVTELKVACFKVIGRRWGGFLFLLLFFAFASVQWFYLVLEEPSPPQNCSKKKVSALRSPGQSSKAGKQEASGWVRSERKWIAPAIPVREEDTKPLVSEDLLGGTPELCLVT